LAFFFNKFLAADSVVIVIYESASTPWCLLEATVRIEGIVTYPAPG
jgi:hypothetical protein